MKSIVAALLVAGACAGVTLTSQTPAPPPAAAQVQAADLVLRGGRIVTLDERVPDAQAIATRAGRIIAVGSNADIARYVAASTQVIELNGQFAMPGFIEGHGHFTGIGEGKLGLELMNTKSWDEILHMVA